VSIVEGGLVRSPSDAGQDPDAGQTPDAGNDATRRGTARAPIQVWAGIYDALTALQAERLGYDALWLSSLGLSAGRLGLPDAGFLQPETVITAVSEISRVTATPINVDFENGYGLSGAELTGLADRFFRAGSRGLCIEDSAGAKRNSLWTGTRRSLATVEDMTQRLRRLVDVAGRHDRMIIARTEALIEGYSIDETVERVHRYAHTGCQAVVVHFRTDVEDALEVARKAATADVQLVVIPTAAPPVRFETFRAAGFDVYVAANVAVRAAMRAVEQGLESVLRLGHQAAALEGVASLAELDSLVRTEALVPQWSA
jgi:phosphoenolpyruvate phosphomutase